MYTLVPKGVRPPGIEPGFSASQANVLSVERRALDENVRSIYKKVKKVNNMALILNFFRDIVLLAKDD